MLLGRNRLLTFMAAVGDAAEVSEGQSPLVQQTGMGRDFVPKSHQPGDGNVAAILRGWGIHPQPSTARRAFQLFEQLDVPCFRSFMYDSVTQ